MIATQSNLQYSRPFRGLTSSVPDRYVVSHAACYVVSPFVVLFVTWPHPSYSCLLRGLTLRSPVRYVVSPFVVLFVTSPTLRSHVRYVVSSFAVLFVARSHFRIPVRYVVLPFVILFVARGHPFVVLQQDPLRGPVT